MTPITMMQAQWRTDSQEGESLRFEECKGGYFSDRDEFGLKVVGRTEQRQLSGKNLFDINKIISSGSVNVNDGTIHTAAGSGSSACWAMAPNTLSDYCPDLKVGDIVTLSANSTGNSKRIHLTKSGEMWNFNTTKTITQDMLDSIVYFYASGVNTTADISNLQIELGSTATEYEPYCGNIPSPNPEYPQEIQCVKAGTKVRCVGKNLIPPMTVGKGININSGGTQNNVYYACTEDYIISDFNQPHTLSFLPHNLTYIVYGYDRNDNFIARTRRYTEPIAITKSNFDQSIQADRTADEISKVRITCYSEGAVFVVTPEIIQGSDIQFENGQATPYEPYWSSEITTPCDLYEGDIWYPMSGKVERNNGIIDSYNSETVQSGWISSTGQLTEGAKIIYPLATPAIESYPPQPIHAHRGTVHVMQIPTDLSADLSATMLVRR